jgi:hypothetical protein
MSAAASAGVVTLLQHGADVTQPWTARELDRTPTAHRVRWVRPAAGAPWLINSPLIGDSLRAPEYRGNTPVYAYRPPEWKREVVTTAEQGVVHSVELVPGFLRSLFGASPPLFASAGFLGVAWYTAPSAAGAPWLRRESGMGSPDAWPRGGSSEIAFVRTPRGPLSATIEPWHGNTLVLYDLQQNGAALRRRVVDSTLTDAHTLLAADLDGDGVDELVAGERGGARSVRVYRLNQDGAAWTRTMLDEGAMAAAGCAAADLNGDGRTDVACIGTATANLRWYEFPPAAIRE